MFNKRIADFFQYSWVASAVTLGSVAYKAIDGAKKKSAANKLASQNVRPTYEIPQEVRDNYNLNLSELGDTSLQDFAARQLQQSQSSGIDAILRSGGKADFGTISVNYGNQLNGLLSTLAKNRDSRIAAVNNAAYALGKSKDAAFEYNQDAPFKDGKQQENALRQQAAQDNSEAISLAAEGVSNYGTQTLKQGQYGSTDLGTDTGGLQGGKISGSVDPITSQNLAAPSSNNIAPINTYSSTPDYSTNSNGDVSGLQIVSYDNFGNPIYAH